MSTTRRIAVGIAALALALAGERALHAEDNAPVSIETASGEKTGGETTVFATGRNAFLFPAANLADDERTRFVVGNSFFRRNWVEAPSSTQARDGLGPHFIARSCGGCHLQAGRGAPPSAEHVEASTGDEAGDTSRAPVAAAPINKAANDQPVALLMRLSIPGAGEHGAPRPEPTYGDQFDNAAVTGVRPEGEVVIREHERAGRFADGTRFSLLAPTYGFRKLGYGPMRREVLASPRIAPQLIGVGLIEAIPEAEILGNAERQRAAADAGRSAVRGQPNRVWDQRARQAMLGRFGWKANTATLAHQVAAAFNGDMGITSTLFPREDCTPTQTDCAQAPRGGADGGVEVDDRTFGDVVFWAATLAPPARRSLDDPAVQRGEALFHQAGCAACHRPSYVTGASPNPDLASPALAQQTIWPYTDVLLHDMGAGLADGRPDFLASGRQWKTPPLWGVGLIPDVNGHRRLLHDGRARGVLEAVLWHGGEADASRRQVMRFGKAEREALVKFVESL